MDDDLDLPDEGTDIVRSSSFVSDLFGSTKRQTGGGSNRSTFDEILANAPKRRQTVTFQDEQPREQQHSFEAGTTAAATVAPQQQQRQGSSLLDSLFSSSATEEQQSGGQQGRRRATGGVPAPTTTGTVASSSGRDGQTAQPRTAAAIHSSTSGPAETTAQSYSSVGSVAILQAELDQLRREVSTLRYERSEDQKTIGELCTKAQTTAEEHQRTVQRLGEQRAQEVAEMGRRHERELEEARREADRSAHILSGIREQEGSFDMLGARIDALNLTLGHLRDSMQAMDGREEAMERGRREQQQEHWKRLSADREHWETAVRAMEQDLAQMREQHTQEIVGGRRWLEQQRELAQAGRRAFQEEQTLVLDWMERKRAELETEKNEFLRREHDLLVRVVNERALLEHDQREFRRQRDGDVLRLREEAEQLEQQLAQVNSARTALMGARRELERKAEQLNDLKEALLHFERQRQSRWSRERPTK